MPFKTFMEYKEGKLIHTELPDSQNPSDIIPIISVTGAVELSIRMFVRPNVITGKIHIESKDRKLYFRCDITPIEALPAVENAIDLFCKEREKMD